MSRLYLITGFLGAGKTTFLRQFLSLFPSEKIRLIINEFGQEGIDGTLLSDLDAVMREISGGSVFCACRMDQFETALQQCGTEDTILVEASGLSDPTGVRRLFAQTDRFPHIQYMGAVCLVDAVRFPKVYATARSAVRQLAASDVVLLNKADRATARQLAHTRELIRGQRPDIPILETSFGQVPSHFLEILRESQNGDSASQPLLNDVSTKRMTVRLNSQISAYELEMFIRMFAENTFRVKGFIQTRDQGTVLVDCVGNVVSVTPADLDVSPGKLGVLTILSGGKMPLRSAVQTACKWYESFVVPDTPHD
ncbi:MAG: CobW family GTP-binding protein [Faecousia sp.]